MMTAKQFAWAHMVYTGRANVQHSYYGGFDVIDKSIPTDSGKNRENRYRVTYNQWHIDRIKEIGVDWDKTQEPQDVEHSEFEGTEAESSRRVLMEGILVLKDGSTQFWVTDPPMSGIFTAMANIDLYRKVFDEIFNPAS